jgi:hypothetical protein
MYALKITLSDSSAITKNEYEVLAEFRYTLRLLLKRINKLSEGANQPIVSGSLSAVDS